MVLFLVLLSALKDSEHREEPRAMQTSSESQGGDTELNESWSRIWPSQLGLIAVFWRHRTRGAAPGAGSGLARWGSILPALLRTCCFFLPAHAWLQFRQSRPGHPAIPEQSSPLLTSLALCSIPARFPISWGCHGSKGKETLATGSQCVSFSLQILKSFQTPLHPGS